MKIPTRITIPAALAILAFALAPAAPAQQASPAKIPTPPEIWKNYDPDAGDFNEEHGRFDRERKSRRKINGHRTRLSG